MALLLAGIRTSAVSNIPLSQAVTNYDNRQTCSSAVQALQHLPTNKLLHMPGNFSDTATERQAVL